MEFSSATNIGLRDKNQDFYGICEDCFCVADGHGYYGEETAKAVVEEIIWNELKPPFKENILSLFQKLDADNRIADDYGSTVSAVWYKNGKFVLAQCGDSPIFYLSEGQVYHLVGHNVANLQNPDVAKLRKDGVPLGEKYQMCPRGRRWLQLTRSIGDTCFGEQVSKIPDILVVDAEAVLICSDGFTGNAEDVKKLFDKKANASEFIRNQEERGIVDNITAITIYEK
jgi:serine/threonine protein phosphatase PrpC